MGLRLRSHPWWQPRRIVPESNIGANSGIEHNTRLARGELGSDSERRRRRVDQIAIMIEEHQRSRREMFKPNLLQCLGKSTAVDHKTLSRGRLRLLTKGDPCRQEQTAKQTCESFHQF